MPLKLWSVALAALSYVSQRGSACRAHCLASLATTMLIGISLPANGLQPLTGASAIAAGLNKTCALMGDGTVKCWGGSNANPADWYARDVQGIRGATALAVGSGHACALLTGGSIQCWGSNTYGELGNQGTTASATPVSVIGIVGATAVAAGQGYTCALVTGGGIKCWGQNYGALGNNSLTNSLTPVDVVGITGASALAAGNFHACAAVAGRAKCWGVNELGQLGNGTTTNALAPVEVVGLTGATAVTAGHIHSCALLGSGSIQCWGNNSYGELGNGTTATYQITPVATAGLSAATVIGAGDLHTCALLRNGDTRCWGSNDHGQLGNNSTLSMQLMPGAVFGLGNATGIAVGRWHTCALFADGTVKCWGINYGGTVGNGTSTPSEPAPAAVLTEGAISSTVVEFYNASLDHYFITWVPDEITKLDNGTFKGWTRTGKSFPVFTASQPATSAVCRIYIPPGKGDGHYFGRDQTECSGTMTKNPTFVLESPSFFHLYPPSLGTCAAGTVPVYRVFTNRADANHRYMTDRALRDQMVAKGWLAEGDGPDAVVMCAPQ